MSTAQQHRILLLTTARSYRNHAFYAAAQRLGIDVVLVSDMAAQLATYWNHQLGVDFNQPDAAAQRIVDFAAGMPVDAICAVDDSGTLVAAKASARLGLAHNAPQAAEAARNKYQMRRLLSQAGVPCPRFQRFTTDDDPRAVAIRVDFPCVVKPLNLSGSRGVMRANNAAEFVAAVTRLTRLLHAIRTDDAPQPYLVEAYIPGGEVALEGILDDGELTVLALFDKPDPLDGPFFEETIYVTPSRLPAKTQAAITDCTARAAAALGLSRGPLHAELRINEKGPRILEVAGRSIGGLCSQTLRFGGNVSLEELILRQACGLEFKLLVRGDNAHGVMMIPIPEAGVLKGVTGVAAAQAVPGIEEVTITAKENYSLVPLPEGDSYLGFIFARSDTPDAVETALRSAHSKLTFQIMPELALHVG